MNVPVHSRPGRDRRASATIRRRAAERSRAPSRATASSLVCGALSGMTTVHGMPQLARAPRHALRHVAGARGVDAARQRVGRQQANGVHRAPQLERADRLQRLELEENLRGRVDVEPDERRAQHRSTRMRSRAARMSSSVSGSMRRMARSAQLDANAGAGARRFGARRSDAAARSSIARPSDLKSVISSSCRAPGDAADEHLADLADDVIGADRRLRAAARECRPAR